MSRLTWFTTTRLRKRLRSLWAIRPSMARGSSARRPAARLGLGFALLLILRIEDALDPAAGAAVHDVAVFRQVHGDALTGDHVVLAPDARAADQHHPLLVVVVFVTRDCRMGTAKRAEYYDDEQRVVLIGSARVTMRTLPVATPRTTRSP